MFCVCYFRLNAASNLNEAFVHKDDIIVSKSSSDTSRSSATTAKADGAVGRADSGAGRADSAAGGADSGACRADSVSDKSSVESVKADSAVGRADSAVGRADPVSGKSSVDSAKADSGACRADTVTEKSSVESVKAESTVRGRRRVSESETVPNISGTTTTSTDDSLPPTLSHLVLFWDELSKYTLKTISENHTAPAPVGSSESTAAVKSKKKDDRGKVAAKKAKEGKMAGALRGNLFGAAADELLARVSGSVDKDSDVMCELCAEEFAHPVTYHMRQVHPGCGKPAGGQGYNSGGNFCGGWAGSCGDGGVGGSTWYLMCDTCRAKYLREKKRGTARKDRLKKPSVASSVLTRKKATAAVGATSLTEPHWMLYHNAMFVLELSAGVASSHVSTIADWERSGVSAGLSSVSEDVRSAGSGGGGGGGGGTVTFPAVPFLYLQLHGACSDDSALTDNNPVQCYRPHSSLSGGTGLDRSVSDSSRHSRHRPLSTFYRDEDESVSGAGKGVFQRSVSEMGGISRGGHGGVMKHDPAGQCEGGASENGLSLVRCPSADMARLIRSLQAVVNVSEYVSHLSVVSFLSQHHELDVLRAVIVQSVRRAACRTYALQALNWLLRTISQPSCLHDLLWHFVAVLSVSAADADDAAVTENAEPVDSDQDVAVCTHPVTGVSVAGHIATKPLVSALHTFLQSVSDVLMHLPAGSAVQRQAVRCWSMQFHAADHPFLHRSHVFSHISRILSSADEAGSTDMAETSSTAVIEQLTDVTQLADVKTSSRQAMAAGMTDGSTETFWESGDEDKNKSKCVMLNLAALAVDCRLRVVCVHVDNARDIANKVSSVMISAGQSADTVEQVRQAELDQRHVGWVCAWVANSSARYVRLELRGADNSLRVRQVKVLCQSDVLGLPRGGAGDVVAQRQCEDETLSVFRLLTSLVFGRLVSEAGEASSSSSSSSAAEAGDGCTADDVDLKEHMVGILFSHSGELTRLQRQVCAHIVGSIRLETGRVRCVWQSESNCNDTATTTTTTATTTTAGSDAYCFELLSLLLALSGSSVGRRYVSQQSSLIQDLVSLLHTAASARVQRQVVLLLRRTLLDITPRSFASLLGITTLPPSDLSALIRSTDTTESYQQGVLDVFLACVAKALSVQVKCRLPGTTAKWTSVTLASSRVSHSDCWWLRGSVPSQLAESIISLLADMSSGRFGVEWSSLTKSAVAVAIVNLSRLSSSSRTVDRCLQSPVIWLALAALCVITDEHAHRLSTGRRSANVAVGSPTCDNHDDGETPAAILCASGCGSLCTECDRVLHLNKRQRLHQRQVTS